jgi:hypothetical protein
LGSISWQPVRRRPPDPSKPFRRRESRFVPGRSPDPPTPFSMTSRDWFCRDNAIEQLWRLSVRRTVRRRAGQDVSAKWIARWAPSFLVLVALSGCNGAVSTQQASAVREAVFKHQVVYWLADHARESGLVICLPLGQGERAAASFLADPRDRSAVRPAEDCDAKPSGAIERATSKPAIIITLTGMTWPTRDEAVVEVEHFRSRMASGRRKYRVVREQGEWICLGPIVDMTPV